MPAWSAMQVGIFFLVQGETEFYLTNYKKMSRLKSTLKVVLISAVVYNIISTKPIKKFIIGLMVAQGTKMVKNKLLS
jgi:hypothetical protein